jgi:hypothetical protein
VGGDGEGWVGARGGLGKVKDAVGLSRTHQKKDSKDTLEPPQTPPPKRLPHKGAPKEFVELPRTPTSPRSPRGSIDDSPKGQWPKRPLLQRSRSSPVSGGDESPKSPTQAQRPSSNLADSIPAQDAAPAYAASYREAPPRQSGDEHSPPPSYMSNDQGDRSVERGQQVYVGSDTASESVTIEPSIAGSVYNDVELNEVLPTGPETEQDVNRLLRRTMSDSQFVNVKLQSHLHDAYPRHLSFSLAEDSVLTWPDVVDKEQESVFDEADRQLAHEAYFAKESAQLQQMIQLLTLSTATFTQEQLETLRDLLHKLEQDQQILTEKIYEPCAEREHNLQTHSETVLRGEQDHLGEAGKELETLAAKLEYEINGLKGRVEEVQAGVGDFERSVRRVEERVGELEKDEKKAAERGWGCVVS